MSHCENCGCKEYGGKCTNCHEILFIEEQYHDLDMEVPTSLEDEISEANKDVERKKGIKQSI